MAKWLHLRLSLWRLSQRFPSLFLSALCRLPCSNGQTQRRRCTQDRILSIPPCSGHELEHCSRRTWSQDLHSFGARKGYAADSLSIHLPFLSFYSTSVIPFSDCCSSKPSRRALTRFLRMPPATSSTFLCTVVFGPEKVRFSFSLSPSAFNML